MIIEWRQALIFVPGLPHAVAHLLPYARSQLPPESQKVRQGLQVDDYFRVKGVDNQNVWALGDCAATSMRLPPTAQAPPPPLSLSSLQARRVHANLVWTTHANPAAAAPIIPVSRPSFLPGSPRYAL